MKKVINGKVYNTETAEEIACYSYGYSGDFNHIEETLYRTKKGAWFIYGCGGPRSKYSVTISQNSWGGGDGWRVLTEMEALVFCEEYAKAEIIEQYFEAEIEEG